MHLYSPEWIAAFNEAVADVPSEPELSFRMLQIVRDAPEGHDAADAPEGQDAADARGSSRGTIEIALDVRGGRLHLERVGERAGAEGTGPTPDVAVSLTYEDALALASGETDPATLISGGRVKVRGDLSVLVRANALLASAVSRLDGAHPPAREGPA